MGILFVTILIFETFYGRIRVFRPGQVTGGERCAPNERTMRDDLGCGAAWPSRCSAAPPRRHPVHLRQPGRVRDREIGAGQPRPGRDAGHGRDDGLRRQLPDLAFLGVPDVLAPWLGVLAAAVVGSLLGRLHAVICNRPRVNSVAVGIAMMVFGIGLAFYLGKPFIQPAAPHLPAVDFGFWSSSEPVQAGPESQRPVPDRRRPGAVPLVDAKNTRWGLVLRLAGESEESAAAMGYSTSTASASSPRPSAAPWPASAAVSCRSITRRLDRADFLRPGSDGRGPGHLRPLGSDPLSAGLAALRGGRLAGAGAAGPGPGLRLDGLPVERRPVRADPGHHDSDRSSRARAMLGSPAELGRVR